MRKFVLLNLLSLMIVCSAFGQQQYRKYVKPTKNVIVMIPDGTSLSVYSAARWYQIYNKLGGDNLAVDPYICGTVKTFNSDAPIGDSAPTTSCYMTGYLSQAGNIAIYPAANPEHDIFPVDTTRSYQPLTTIFEAAKLDKKKSTGLVITVDFPHATPADCAAHYYNRRQYNYLSSQIAYNNVDVVFGAGTNRLTDDIKDRLAKTDTKLIVNDVNEFRKFEGDEKVWALFGKRLPYDHDRDDSKYPSLAEMTSKAINRLNKNDEGFFLMVEGSQVDWAAHSNDGIALMTEYLAFDRAVQAAIDFAKKDGETTVVIMSDHGNSGFSIGSPHHPNYANSGLHELYNVVSQYKSTGRNLEGILLKKKPEEFKATIKEYTNIDITEDEYKELLSSKNYKQADYTEVANSVNMLSTLTKIMNARTPFGFIYGGHTGEEVLLSAYHPEGHVPNGMNTNQEINQYLFDAVGLPRPLDEVTAEIYAKHYDVFAVKGIKYSIDTTKEFPELIVKKGKKTLVVPAFKSIAFLNGVEFELGSITNYTDKNGTFYLPANLIDKLK